MHGIMIRYQPLKVKSREKVFQVKTSICKSLIIGNCKKEYIYGTEKPETEI